MNAAIQTAPVYPPINLMGKGETRHPLLALSAVNTFPLANRTSMTSIEEEIHASKSDISLANEAPAHITKKGGVQRATWTSENVTSGVGGTVVRNTARQESVSHASKQLSSSSSRPSPAANAIWTKKPEETRYCPVSIKSGEANLAVTADPRKVRRSAAEEAYLRMLEMEEAAEVELEAKKKKQK